MPERALRNVYLHPTSPFNELAKAGGISLQFKTVSTQLLISFPIATDTMSPQGTALRLE